VLAITPISRRRLLLFLDRPVERFVIAHRSPRLDWVFNHLSFLGSTQVVADGGRRVLALAALPRCRAVSALVVTATWPVPCSSSP